MTVIQCMTQRAPPLLGGRRTRRLARQYLISVTIDGETMTYSDPFQYMKDSEVTGIYPGSTIHRSANEILLFYIAPDKMLFIQPRIFDIYLVSPHKHMLWLLIGSTSLRCF